MPYDSPLLRVNTLGSDEGSMTLQELMVFCITLSKKVESLETDLKQDQANIGAIDLDDSFQLGGGVLQLIRFLAFHCSLLRKILLVTAELFLSVGQLAVTTVVLLVSTGTKTKLQQEQERLDFKAVVDDCKLNCEEESRGCQGYMKQLLFNVEDIVRHYKARVMLMEESLSTRRNRYFAAKSEERRKQATTQLTETYLSNYLRTWEVIHVASEVDKAIPKLSSKRVAEEELDQESSKRQKTGKSSELAKEPRDKEADELSQEEMQQMMIIVPEQEMNVETLQTKCSNKYPINVPATLKNFVAFETSKLAIEYMIEVWFVIDNLVFSELDDGVGVVSVTVNSWSFSVSEDTRSV
ncbi:hypothetical protein Tco_0347994 [Tanacetum coccineum]